MSVMNIVTACIVILIMAVLSVVAIRVGYKALLIEWAIDAISKAEKEFVGTKLGEARLAVDVSWLREKVPAPIRFLVTDDLIRKAVQTSFNAAKSGLEVLKNAYAACGLALGSSSRNEMDRIADTHRRLKGGYRCLQEQPKCLLSPFRRGSWRRWRS